MKEHGFVALLEDRGFKPKNAGFYNDRYGKTGVCCKIKVKEKPYAIWMMQKDFPRGIYAITVTQFNSCVIWPSYLLYTSRNMLEAVAWVEGLKDGIDESDPEIFTHPWSVLSQRIESV